MQVIFGICWRKVVVTVCLMCVGLAHLVLYAEDTCPKKEAYNIKCAEDISCKIKKTKMPDGSTQYSCDPNTDRKGETGMFGTKTVTARNQTETNGTAKCFTSYTCVDQVTIDLQTGVVTEECVKKMDTKHEEPGQLYKTVACPPLQS